MGIPTIIWILILFFSFRLLFRWLAPLVLPMIIKRFLKKQGMDVEQFNQQKHQPINDTQKFTQSKPSSTSNDDEYIDFEELK